MSLEYRSAVAWRGLPLIHIALGPRQAGYSARRARGVIAVGYTAQGLLAVGIVALGIVAVGPVALGVASVGVVALGLVAAGVVAVGLVANGDSRRRSPGSGSGGAGSARDRRRGCRQGSYTTPLNTSGTLPCHSLIIIRETGNYARLTRHDRGCPRSPAS
jgi:hypothetical protein